MTTKEVIQALISIERDEMREYTKTDIDDFAAWKEWTAGQRYEWSALFALQSGNTAQAQVLASLAQAAATKRVGMELDRLCCDLDAKLK